MGRAGQVPQGRMSREGEKWASSRDLKEGSMLPCGGIRCFSEAHHHHEWGVDQDGSHGARARLCRWRDSTE